ncbi:hypothetical protein GE09DRAFT_1109113 [Coniochaeta sp. 2T2.1]|nr:hypothetical protein GE09DRAFT_1109113 [Coniochaeta sp. 2T2.1]
MSLRYSRNTLSKVVSEPNFSMSSIRPSSAVKLAGFYFGPGPVFSHDQETAHRIRAGLLGEDTSSLSALGAKERAAASVQALFECAMNYRDFYRNVRGGEIFCVVIANQTALHDVLISDDVKLVVQMMARARANYQGNDSPTPLNQLVDSLIEMKQEVAAMPLTQAPQGLALSTRPSEAGAAAREAGRVSAGLASNMVGMNIAQPAWPPEHFTPTDLVFPADNNVTELLSGVDTDNTQPRQQLPPVDSRSLPILLRIHLCHLALTRRTARKDWVLFLTPVGFLRYTDRRRWFLVGGQQTKVFTTVPRFLAYADEAMRRCVYNAVGLFCHWIPQSQHVDRVEDLVRDDPADVWTDREMMRRYAAVMILRRIATPLGMRIHVVWYDPWFRDGIIRQQFGHGEQAITDYRVEVNEMLNQWAAENRIEIESKYYRGPVSSEAGVAGDSVRQCFNFIETVTSGKWFELPEPEDEQALLNMGFVPVC